MGRMIYQKYRSLINDIAVAALCFLSLFMYCYLDSSDLAYSLLYSATLTGFSPIVFLIIHFVPVKGKDDIRIYENKAAIFPFIIIQLILIMLVFLSRRYLGIYNGSSQKIILFITILLKVFLVSILCISYLFKIRFKHFHWNIKINEILLIMVIYILMILCMNAHLIIDGTINIKSLIKPSLIADFIIKMIRKSLYPGVFEEVLYRGLLISGLKGFGLKDEHTNII